MSQNKSLSLTESDEPKITIRWYIESGRSSPGEVCLEYEFVSSDGVIRRSGGANLRSAVKRPPWAGDSPMWRESPAVTKESVLAELTDQIEREGYIVTVEHGHYKQVWVPDEE